GWDIVNPASGSRPRAGDGARARAIKLECFDNGMIIETGGRNSAVLRFLPPLNIPESEVGTVLARFEQALRSSSAARVSSVSAVG
ncbi:diaminobutyrate--2-oxoglutarate transaminase, partial [Pseudomonas syringae]